MNYDFIKSKKLQFFCIFVLTFFSAKLCYSNNLNCGFKELNREEIIKIVKDERAIRPDLPKELQNSKIEITHDRCFYTYRENLSNPIIGFIGNTIIINKKGVIINSNSGNSVNSSFVCSDLADPEFDKLSRAVENLRENDISIPQKPQQSKAKIIKSGCMFLYWETPLPEKVGVYNIFTFDRDGDLYRFDEVKGIDK